jgi:predicted Zn-dependent peptidase
MLKPIVLKNGLTILRFPKASSNVFLTGFLCHTGSSIEEGYFPQGISRFIEKMFWYGTSKHPSSKKLNQVLEQMGGDFSSTTSQELLQMYLTVPTYNQYKATSMMAEIVQTSYFDEQDIKQEQKFMLQNMSDFSDFQDFSNLSTSSLYANSSLGLPVLGSVETITNINQEVIFEYLCHQFRPDNCYLVLAGNFDNKQVLELAEQEWSIWSPKIKKIIKPLDFHIEDVGELPRVIYRQRGVAQTILNIAFLLDEGARPKELETENKTEINNKNSKKEMILEPEKILEKNLHTWAKLLLLNTILGQGLSSRLWLKTVEEEMLFNKITSDLIRFSTTGYIEIMGVIENLQFTFGLESVFSVIEALKKTTVSINELQKAKEYIKGKFILSHENLLDSTVWQVENFLISGLNFEVRDLLEEVQKVEAAEIRALASDLFNAQKMAITTLGTAKSTRLVDKLIKKYLF